MNIPPPSINQINERIKNIELLRFILAWVIALFHFYQYPRFFGWANEYRFWGQGYMGVEMFFVIAFFFLVIQSNKEKSWMDFCISKWIRLSPILAVISLIGYILYLYKIENMWSWIDNLENIFCIQTWLKFPAKSAVPQAWYCSTLFGVSCIYLLLAKSFSKPHLTFLVAALCFIGLYDIVRPKELALLNAYTNNGVCRAFFCLGIGYLLASAYKNKKESSKHNVLLYTMAELVLICILIYPLIDSKAHTERPIQVIAFAALFWIFLNKRGLISRMLERNWCVVLGRYSYAIFIVHIFVRTMSTYAVRQNWCLGLNQSHPSLFVFLMCIATMVCAMLAYHLVEAPTIKWYKKRKKKIKEDRDSHATSCA